MRNEWIWIGLLAAWASTATAAAQEESLFPNTRTEGEDGHAPQAKIEQLAWMAGHWIGEGLGGVCEEVWSPAADGAMMGMFRLIREGKVVFYEFQTLVEQDGSLVLKLKHFHPDLVGWEEKDGMVRFPLVHVEKDAVWFRGLTYRKDSDGTLSIFLRLRGKDGVVQEVPFSLRREKASF